MKDKFSPVRDAFSPVRLLADLREMGQVGLKRADGSRGRTRLALTPDDKEARDLLSRRMREAGLDVRVDAIGNIFGVFSGETRDNPVMAGSHIDTVEEAGHLDGAYGVLAALAVARALSESGVTPPRSFVAAAFTNEEGVRFQPDMMGSLVHVGGLSPEDALDSLSVDGRRLGTELAAIGYDGGMVPGAIRPSAYLELHVEQGPVLESENRQIGVVTGVQGIFWQKVAATGQANHAGGTPTRMRRNAGLAAARIALGLRDISEKRPETLGTVGTILFEPNQINVIPGKAELTIDLRDPDPHALNEAKGRLVSLMQEISLKDGVQIATRTLADFPPTPFDPAMIDLVEKVTGDLGYSSRRMVSGAGHDAQMLARICPAGMIFVPSRGGRSHCPQEHTPDDDLERGARVLLEAALELLQAPGPSRTMM